MIQQKNQEKLAAETEQTRAKEAVRQAAKALADLEKEIATLQTQLTKLIQERNQLEQQCRQAANLVEETKYAIMIQFQLIGTIDSIDCLDNKLKEQRSKWNVCKMN